MSDHFIVAASMEGLTPKKDGSMSMRFTTYILSDEQKHVLLSMYGKSGFLHFKDGEIAPEEKEMLDSCDMELSDNKSMSQRLRNVMYRFWESKHKDYCDFKTLYQNEMMKLLTHYKDKID